MSALKLNHKLFQLLTGNRPLVLARGKTTAAADHVHKDDEDDDIDTPVVLVQDEEDVEEREARINAMRNKSGLLPQHLKFLKNQKPYEESQSWVHETVKYKRMMFGRYGLASGVDPRICFDSPAEEEEKLEYRRVAFPHTLPEMMQANEADKNAKVAKIRTREEDIAKKMAKLDQWVTELHTKKAKKEAEAKAAKERKDRLVEEVRRHFGFKLDIRDERFKEMLDQKEREDRKKQKEAKRQVKEAKMIEKLSARTAAAEQGGETKVAEEK